MKNFFKYRVSKKYHGDKYMSSTQDRIFIQNVYLGSFFLLTLAILTILVFPHNKSFKYAGYRIGMLAPEQIVSPAHFEIDKLPEEYEREKELKRRSIPPIFYRDTIRENTAIQQATLFFDQILYVQKIENEYQTKYGSGISAQKKADTAFTQQSSNLKQKMKSAAEDIRTTYDIDIEKPEWSFIYSLNDQSFETFSHTCIGILKDVYASGILNIIKKQVSAIDTSITVIESGSESAKSIHNYFDSDDIRRELAVRLSTVYESPGDIINSGLEILLKSIKPDIIYDSDRTEQARRKETAAVPRSRGYVQKGEIIVNRNERVTDDQYKKILSLQEYLLREIQIQYPHLFWLVYSGQIGVIAVIFILFGSYLYFFRPALIKEIKIIIIIFILFLIQILLIYWVLQRLHLSEYLIPTTITSMLLAIFIDTELALIGTVVVAILVGVFAGNNLGIALYVLSGGAIGILAVRHIRHISQFLKAIIAIAGAYGIVLCSVGVLQGYSIRTILSSYFIYSIPNAVLSPLITIGFIRLFELIFDEATDIKLLELSDLNNKLLRELSMQAPGTYHHSIILGNLCERAAEAIGANSLLARVGCYYHDIGKIAKPEYYMENEPVALKTHETLAPSLSSLIIASHVRNGIEIAQKHKLPGIIKDLISQHHGTSQISFFYEKALGKNKDASINPADFCYPGPKPQTREAGIIMLADGVEAATRALKNPSPTRVRERVESIVMQRFKEGQLDECELTMKDIRIITESFIKILSGIFHLRIEYPTQIKNLTAS